MIEDEELVSAAKRNFVIGIEPKQAFRNGPAPNVVVVKAYSVAQAKREAIKKVSVGRYKNRTPAMWKITSCEEVPVGQ